ncbi:unnamed protein product [Peronospora effusa]|nr:unnamed protein product [Peronospora effusa]
MLVSNNNEAALAVANRPPDTKKQGRNHRSQMIPVAVVDEEMKTKQHGLVVGPKHPLVHELTAMLRPKRPAVSSNEDDNASAYEYDDLPILESNRTSCCTPRDPVIITASTVDEPMDRFSDSVPEGELHVWVYEARELSASWSLTDTMYKEHGLRVRCGLLGAMQESPCNISGNKKNPVWRDADNKTRDELGGYFAWALGQPEETAGDRLSRGVEASECKLEIDVICGERIVGLASVALEDLLLSSKDRAFEEDALESRGSKVVRLSPHWLPLVGNNSGSLQISLDFIPVPNQMLRGSSRSVSLVNSSPEVSDEHDADNQANDGVAGQWKSRFPRNFVKGRPAVPWLDQCHDAFQLDTEDEASSSSNVIVSRSGGVTMYIPTQVASTPPKVTTVGSLPLASKPSTLSFGQSSTEKCDEVMDKQLWDLYYFGISDEARNKQDPEDFTCTMAMTSDYSAGVFNVPSRPEASSYCRQESTSVSDVLAYNELIQDMESAMKSMEDTAPSRRTDSNQGHAEDQSKMETTGVKSPTSKLHLKMRRIHKPNLNFSKPLDRIHSLWHDAKARASNSSDTSNDSISSKERSPWRTKDRCWSSSNTSPLAFRSRSKTPSPSRREGVVLVDYQNLFVRFPYQRSASRDEATTKAKRERRAAEDEPRRRSLPINIFSLQHRQEMLLQQQHRKRLPKQQLEGPRDLQPFLLESVDPPLLSRDRSNTLHSMTDLFLPKTGDMHGVQVTTPVRAASPASSRAIRGTAKRTTTRRHSGSNVVYINGSPLCVGKFINVGNVPGVVRFIGTTRFATGTWVGIELYEQKGKNSGTINGEQYFSCAPNHGIFIRASRLCLSLQ